MASVLTPGVLAVAELSSARLDGELYGLDEAFVPVDEVESSRTRASVLRGIAGTRLIAELDSALWVRGVTDRPPRVHTMCVARANRVKFPPSPRILVREVGHEIGDVEPIGGLPVTAPGRILYDLAFVDDRDRRADAVPLLRRFPEIADACAQRVADARSVPGKVQAMARIVEWQKEVSLR